MAKDFEAQMKEQSKKVRKIAVKYERIINEKENKQKA